MQKVAIIFAFVFSLFIINPATAATGQIGITPISTQSEMNGMPTFALEHGTLLTEAEKAEVRGENGNREYGRFTPFFKKFSPYLEVGRLYHQIYEVFKNRNNNMKNTKKRKLTILTEWFILLMIFIAIIETISFFGQFDFSVWEWKILYYLATIIAGPFYIFDFFINKRYLNTKTEFEKNN